MEMPNAPVVDQDAIPAAMKRYDHWVTWKYVYIPDKDRWTKEPFNPQTGRHASSTNSDTWSDFETAIDAVDIYSMSGVGFMFSPDAPFMGIDIDKAIDSDGVISAVPQIILRGLNSYTELSPSGLGYHTIIRGELPEAYTSSNPGKSGKKTTAYEVYRSRRFFTVTGNSLPEYPQSPKERSNELGALWSVMFPESRSDHGTQGDIRPDQAIRREQEHVVGGLSDTDIINRALIAANGSKFDSLFHRGDTSQYGGDDSAADLALCNMLAFWTQDPGQIERIWGQSALGQRGKYHRADYRERTLAACLNGVRESFSGRTDESSRIGSHIYLGEGDSQESVRTSPESISTRRLVVTRADGIEIQPIRWLWPSWLSLGKIHVLGGAPGDGKSTISLDLAARLSTGALAPDGKHTLPQCNTIIMASEDGAGDTIAPNLKRFGADMGRIFHVSSAMQGDKEDIISLHEDLDLIEQAVIEHDAKFVIIDPITNYTGNSDNNSEKDVRRVLMPVKQMAERLDISILCIMHVSKPGGSPRSALQSLMGSTAFGGVARTVWMNVVVPDNEFENDPEEEEEGELTFQMEGEGKPPRERIMGVIKSNVDDFPDAISWVRRKDGPVEWQGKAPFTVQDVLTFSDSKTNKAIMLLRARLKNGEVESTVIEAEAKEEGISLRTLKIARQRLRVKAHKGYGVKGTWTLSLPLPKK